VALTCIFGDSFDFYNSLALYWDTPGTDTAIDFTAGRPRTGIGCLRITSAAYGPTKVFTAGANLLCTTAFNPDTGVPFGTKANIMWLIDSLTANQQIRVCYEPDLSVSVYNGNDPFPLLLGQSAAGVIDTVAYNYITCKAFIHATLGTVQIRVNGALVLNLVNVRTRAPGSNAQADTFELMCLGSHAGFHDDSTLWTWDDPADDITTVPRIYAFVPVSDSAPLQWTPSAGGTHFNLLDEVPQNTADYVSDDTAGDIDQYIHGWFAGEQNPVLPATFQVLANIHAMLAELDVAGAHGLASDANGSVGAATALTTNYKYTITCRTPGPVLSLADLAVVPFGPDLVT
jgi:hypothetical protein